MAQNINSESIITSDMAENVITDEPTTNATPVHYNLFSTMPQITNGSTLQDALNRSGELIKKGGTMKNVAITCTVVGGVVGGTLISVGAYQQNKSLYTAGSVVTAAFGLTAFILDVIGNKRIKEGGKLLQNVQFSGNAIQVTF